MSESELVLTDPPRLSLGRIGETVLQAVALADWPSVLACQTGDWPTPSQLERQIDLIEAWLMPVLRQRQPELPGGLLRVSPASFMAQLLPAATSQGPAGVADIEARFALLARVAAGSPVSLVDFPLDRHFIACLVLLREVMHHGGFAGVRAAEADGAICRPGTGA